MLRRTVSPPSIYPKRLANTRAPLFRIFSREHLGWEQLFFLAAADAVRFPLLSFLFAVAQPLALSLGVRLIITITIGVT